MGYINIGILLPRNTVGGVFQYSINIVDCLLRYSSKYGYQIFFRGGERDICDFSSVNARVNVIRVPAENYRNLKTVVALFNLLVRNKPWRGKKESPEIPDLSLMIVPFPDFFAFHRGIPYIVSVPDLMHKYYPGFPEFSFVDRVGRDIFYKYSARNSLITVVDDEQGIEDLHRFYKIPREKIRVLRYIPPYYIYENKEMGFSDLDKVASKFNLPERFLFYPSQFWHHKNHINLIKALILVREKYKTRISLVLVGHPQHKYEEIVNFIRGNGMSEQVLHLGYVSPREVVALYKKSVALVYPSLFGPTNIPPLEAMVLGTPVICSNLFSMPRQVGDAGVLFNPFDIGDMAEKIYRVWTDENLRREMVKKGYERVKDLTPENYARSWEGLIDEALTRI